jgi:hypothetical protein
MGKSKVDKTMNNYDCLLCDKSFSSLTICNAHMYLEHKDPKSHTTDWIILRNQIEEQIKDWYSFKKSLRICSDDIMRLIHSYQEQRIDGAVAEARKDEIKQFLLLVDNTDTRSRGVMDDLEDISKERLSVIEKSQEHNPLPPNPKLTKEQ